MADTLEIARQVPLPASTSTFELELEQEQPTGVNESSLPPVDRGFRAWSFMSAAFLVQAIVWGLSNSFGVFLEAYLQDPVYTNQRNPTALLSLIGPLSSGIIYCSGPFINLFITRFPFHRRTVMWLGVACCWTSLFGASYTTRARIYLRSECLLDTESE
uniref:Putative monocarboxylate transporter 2 n=1 Tax=Moniliophthora roreri TaxID=221103 RepID=A0A0W0G9P6_MONRR